MIYTCNGRSNTYAKFSEMLTFRALWYTYVRVPISGLKFLVLRKRLRTYYMDNA